MTDIQNADIAMTAAACDHVWISHHKEGHLVYWVKVCMICGEPDWDDLDEQIAEFAG